MSYNKKGPEEEVGKHGRKRREHGRRETSLPHQTLQVASFNVSLITRSATSSLSFKSIFLPVNTRRYVDEQFHSADSS
jgi:hypothetical protein